MGTDAPSIPKDWQQLEDQAVEEAIEDDANPPLPKIG